MYHFNSLSIPTTEITTVENNPYFEWKTEQITALPTGHCKL